MNKRRVLIVLTILSAICYGVILFMLGTNYYNLQETYEDAEQKYTSEIDRKIRDIIMEEKDITDAFDDLKEESPLEIVVIKLKDESTIYQSIDFAESQDLEDAIDKGAIASEGAGMMEGKTDNYYVWYAIYHMPMPDVLESLFSNQLIYLGVAFLIILILIIGVQYLSIRPLYYLMDSMDKLSKYEFENIEATDADSLSKKMGEISSKLSETFKEVSKKYTQLEIELQEEKERLANTLQISKALVHDLKTPVHQTLLENEHMLKHMEHTEKAALDISVYNMNRLDGLMKEINQVLKVLGDEGYKFDMEKESFDLIGLLTDTLRRFKGSLVKKNLSFNLNIPESLEVYLNRVSMQLLLHNIISNMVQYAEKDSLLTIEVIDEGSVFQLISTNKSSEKNIEIMKNSEKLFNVVEAQVDKEHTYSSGNGLFLIKDLVHFLNGDYDNQTKEGCVILSLRIPVGKEA